MKKTPSMKSMVAAIYIASIIGGFMSFYLAGGIPKLASDVGISGAWGLSVFVQLIYATLILVGFAIYLVVIRKLNVFSPTLISVAISSVLISSAINLYGVFRTGPGVEFALGAVVVIGSSVALLFIAAIVCNGLTRHSAGREKRAG